MGEDERLGLARYGLEMEKGKVKIYHYRKR